MSEKGKIKVGSKVRYATNKQFLEAFENEIETYVLEDNSRVPYDEVREVMNSWRKNSYGNVWEVQEKDAESDDYLAVPEQFLTLIEEDD